MDAVAETLGRREEMKGVFIPEISVETLKNASLDTIEDFFSRILNDGDVAIWDAELPRWIPVTERLPDDLAEVNVTWVNHNPEPYYDFVKDKAFTATAIHYRNKWYWSSSRCADILAEYMKNDFDEIDEGIEIIAWMPLPESYKGEQG